MTWSQILAVALAAIASAAFFQAARLLGPEGTGWHGAPWAVRLALDLFALFWAAAAVYAMTHPAIVNLLTIVLAVVFAKIGLLVLVLTLRRRVAPIERPPARR